MTSRFSKILSVSLAIMMLLSVGLMTLAACDPDSTKVYYDNETDPIVFTTQEVDKVFNPFFSTSAMDSNVVGMTQIGMIANDEKGNPVYGDGEAVVAKDLEIVTEGTPDVDQTTTYYFVLKNDVKFSNGSPLTIKDVFFNLYVYLDPAYTGSSTIYSTDIVGLDEYRTQTADENEQDQFEEKYRVAARARIDALIDAVTNVLDDHVSERHTPKWWRTSARPASCSARSWNRTIPLPATPTKIRCLQTKRATFTATCLPPTWKCSF